MRPPRNGSYHNGHRAGWELPNTALWEHRRCDEIVRTTLCAGGHKVAMPRAMSSQSQDSMTSGSLQAYNGDGSAATVLANAKRPISSRCRGAQHG